MSNPVLNERTLRTQQNVWAPPAVEPSTQGRYVQPNASTATMTVGGAISKTALLLGVVFAAAAVGWNLTKTTVDEFGQQQLSVPLIAMIGVGVGFVLTGVLYFKPLLAKYIAPAYAVAEGIFVGAVSKVFQTAFDGIVAQAIGATLAVLLVMLGLYTTRIIRVTERFRSVVISATIGLMVFYLFSFVLRLFGLNVEFLSQPSLLGIGFSVFAAGLAAVNLLLDFDIIERGAYGRFDKNFEWYAAFGLLVTIVWLYLELLRLIAKLTSR